MGTRQGIQRKNNEENKGAWQMNIFTKYYYMKLNEWHHMYLGVLILISHTWLPYDVVLFTGSILVIDDAIQHFWQGFAWYNNYLELERKGQDVSIDHKVGVFYYRNFLGKSEPCYKPHSPLHILYQITLAKIPFIAKFNHWLDKRFK
jgi:hypothetical protein